MMDPAAMDVVNQSLTQVDFEKVVSCGRKVTRRILGDLTLKEISNLAASSATVFKAIFDLGHRPIKSSVGPSSHSCTECLPDAKDSYGSRLWTGSRLWIGSEADISYVIEAIGRGMDDDKKSYGQQVAIHVMDSLSRGAWGWCIGDDALVILSATGILVNSLLRLEPQEGWRSAIKTIVGPFLRDRTSTLIGPRILGVDKDLEDLIRSILHQVLWRHIPDESKGQVIEIVLEEFGVAECTNCRIVCQALLFFVWFRPNCLGSYKDLCWQKLINVSEYSSYIDHLGPQHLEIFLGPMAKALSIIYKTIQDRGGNEEQLNDFWVFLEKLSDIDEYDYLWEPDNLAVVLFLASESFRLWFLNMKADNLKGSGDNVSELARTAALLVVLASKFDRQLDQVSTTIIDLVTDARLADHTKIFIKEFWATLMASLEVAMENRSGGRRPKLLTAVTKFGQAMMPFAYPPPVTIKKRTPTPSTSTATPSTSTAASSEEQGRRAASTSNAKVWSGEE